MMQKSSNHKRKKESNSNPFYHQDINDPRTYAGRRRPKVKLGGLGDDGLMMTPNRMNSHRLFNGFFIWGFLSVAIGVILAISSFLQGATLDPWSMISEGGATVNGIEIALLLRLEALFAMITGAVFFGTSFLGFGWLYDKQPLSTSKKWIILNSTLAVGWFSFFIASVNIPEPLSIIIFISTILYIKFTSGVERDKHSNS